MQNNAKIEEALKSITILYYALAAGQLMSVAMFFVMVKTQNAGTDPNLTTALAMAVAAIGIGGYIVGNVLYKQQGVKAKAVADESEKIGFFRTGLIITWGLMEAPGLFSGISYLLTGDELFIYLFGVLFIGFLYLRPTIQKYEEDFR